MGHNFSCDCLACAKNYRMLTMRDHQEACGVINPIEHARLCAEYKIDAVMELIPKYCDYLTENAEFFPEYHTNIAEELLWGFFKLIYNNEMPLAHKLDLKK